MVGRGPANRRRRRRRRRRSTVTRVDLSSFEFGPPPVRHPALRLAPSLSLALSPPAFLVVFLGRRREYLFASSRSSDFSRELTTSPHSAVFGRVCVRRWRERKKENGERRAATEAGEARKAGGETKKKMDENENENEKGNETKRKDATTVLHI